MGSTPIGHPKVVLNNKFLMKLSFAIPAYNEAENIGKCLDSILNEVKKNSYTNDVEIIVVDNASTDNTAEIAKKYTEVKVVPESRKGLCFARQQGYLSATGDIIANVDADSVLSPGWINKVFTEFSKDNNLVALSGPVIYYDLGAFDNLLTSIFLHLGFVLHLINHHILRRGSMLQGGNFILRKSALDKANGFDLSVDFYGEDTNIARRISPLGRVKFTFQLPMYTSGRRLRAEGVITTGARYAINHFWILIFNKPFTKKYKDIRF